MIKIYNTVNLLEIKFKIQFIFLRIKLILKNLQIIKKMFILYHYFVYRS
jgi:hypothetical protein